MLMRFDPFRELDRLTETALAARSTVMPMDAYRHNDQFLVQFDLPGVNPETIDLTVEQNVLTVKAERAPQRGDAEEIIVTERPVGTFTRQLFLGESLNTEQMQANYDAGVLTINIPVAEQAKPRKVQVGSATNGKKVISASSS